MKSVAAILLLSACALAQNGTPAKPTAAQLVGTWRLVSMTDTMKEASVKPPEQLGPHAIGFLMYEADGHMCASIMNPDRPSWTNSAKPTNEEKIAYYDTFIAYCGTYRLDEDQSIVLIIRWWRGRQRTSDRNRCVPSSSRERG